MPFFIVTDRGGSRDYATLVEVDGPEDGQLYIRAQEKAAQQSREIAGCGKEVSAFRLTHPKLKKWLEFEKRLAETESSPERLEEYRKSRAERQAFLESL